MVSSGSVPGSLTGTGNPADSVDPYGPWGTLRALSGEAGALPRSGGALSGALAPAVVMLTDAATVAVNAALGNGFRLTFTSAVGNSRAIGNPASPADGQGIVFELIQDGAGGRSVTWGTAYAFGTAGAPALTATAGAADNVGFRYSSAKGKWLFQGSAAGF